MARILYLDDEEPLVFLVTRMLQVLVTSPSGFTSASEAIAAFRASPGVSRWCSPIFRCPR